MEIIKKKLERNRWTAHLNQLEPEEECLVADRKNRASIQLAATRITQKTGVKFTFKKDGDKINVWKLK